MARKRTGTIERRGDKLRARVTVTLVDGTKERVWFTLDSRLSDAKAQKVAAQLSERLGERPIDRAQLARLKGKTQGGSRTIAEFYANIYTKHVEVRRHQDSYWRHHILPAIGGENVRTFGAAPLRALVERLDGAVEDGALRSTTATVIWATARKFCGDLVKSKKAAVRIRDDNPAANVLGPDRAPAAEKQWLFPVELTRFLASPKTPLQLGRFVAVSVHLCCRPGETYGLHWGAIDLEHQTVRIHQSRDPQTGTIGRTKGKDVRSFPIPEPLVPVLRAMRNESDGEGFLFSSCPTGGELRAALLAAGVARHELHHTTESNRAIRLHDCRATGLSYLAMMGSTDDEVRERAGHKSFQTTLTYLRRGKLAGRVGDPRTPLPERLGQLPTAQGRNPTKLAKVIPMHEKNTGKAAVSGAGRIPEVYEEPPREQCETGPEDDSLDEWLWLQALADDRERALAYEVATTPLKKVAGLPNSDGGPQ